MQSRVNYGFYDGGLCYGLYMTSSSARKPHTYSGPTSPAFWMASDERVRSKDASEESMERTRIAATCSPPPLSLPSLSPSLSPFGPPPQCCLLPLSLSSSPSPLPPSPPLFPFPSSLPSFFLHPSPTLYSPSLPPSSPLSFLTHTSPSTFPHLFPFSHLAFPLSFPPRYLRPLPFFLPLPLVLIPIYPLESPLLLKATFCKLLFPRLLSVYFQDSPFDDLVGRFQHRLSYCRRYKHDISGRAAQMFMRQVWVEKGVCLQGEKQPRNQSNISEWIDFAELQQKDWTEIMLHCLHMR